MLYFRLVKFVLYRLRWTRLPLLSLLEDMDQEMNSTQDRLKAVISKVDKTLAISRDGKQSCCICLLIITVFILMMVYVTK